MYFADNYPWSLTVAMLFDEVATFGEIDDALAPLKPLAGGDKAIANEAWYQAMMKLAENLERLGTDDRAEGHDLSAARKHHRAGLYYLRAERFAAHGDPRGLLAYKRGVEHYRLARKLENAPVEFLDIPFRGSTFPAMFVKAKGEGKRPCVVFQQGFDSLKELFYPVGGTQFRDRGVSLLVIDQPGAGGALRLNGLTALVESEHAVGAAIDYLETRPDIDADRIGVMGISLGGYYAPRAAAFEKRIKACLCWGAIWDFGARWEDMASDSKKFGSIPDMAKHAMWVFGQKDMDGVLAFGKQIRCEPFADKITCDFFIVHGENDRQVPLHQAELLYNAAVNAKSRKMKVFKLSDGGAEHCQVNNRTLAADALADYAAETLGGEVNGVQ